MSALPDTAQALAAQYRLPFTDLADFAIPRELFEQLPAAEAYRRGIAPVRRHRDALEVAVADPSDPYLPEKLERLCGVRVRLVVAPAAAIHAALKRSAGSAEVLRDVSEDFRAAAPAAAAEGGEAGALHAEGQDAPVVRLVNALLVAALQKRATDIHIEAHERGIALKYRIDGVLYPATEPLGRDHHATLVSRLKVMAELDIAEKRLPQDGRFKLALGERGIDFRVSILPGAFGEDVVIRILDKAGLTRDLPSLRLDGLGMEPEAVRRLRRAASEPYGMVLITGPTGSGKTTTLYAALSELNAAEEKIITIEDPVEYQLDNVVQIPVNEKKGLTFARGLRSILRHDPDKIMVGEIRDTETAQIAVQSALTGHLVFTTVHANNAFDVIGRFSHMGLDLYNFVSALNFVMAQRLVRRVCEHCARSVQPGAAALEAAGLPAAAAGRNWREGAGCAHCNGTGYLGRSAITECVNLTPGLRDLIAARRPLGEIRAAALAAGMRTLRQSALDKAFAGETTLREINRVTFVD